MRKESITDNPACQKVHEPQKNKDARKVIRKNVN